MCIYIYIHILQGFCGDAFRHSFMSLELSQPSCSNKPPFKSFLCANRYRILFAASATNVNMLATPQRKSSSQQRPHHAPHNGEKLPRDDSILC